MAGRSNLPRGLTKTKINKQEMKKCHQILEKKNAFPASSSTPRIGCLNEKRIKGSNSDILYQSFLQADGNLKPQKREPNQTFGDDIMHTGVKSLKKKKVCFSPSARSKQNLFIKDFKEPDKTMMGYDWIAGFLDNDSSISDRSDRFFEEIEEFRRENRDDCKSDIKVDVVSTLQPRYELPTLVSEERENHSVCCDGSGSYMIDGRLNLIPIHGRFSNCPTCKSKVSYEEDGYIRVTIPRSTIQSPYHLRPHRRKSFDPSDSVALSAHCLAGWQNSKPTNPPGPTNIDLISNASKSGLKTVRSLRKK